MKKNNYMRSHKLNKFIDNDRKFLNKCKYTIKMARVCLSLKECGGKFVENL